jgi:hypothetical protein
MEVSRRTAYGGALLLLLITAACTTRSTRRVKLLGDVTGKGDYRAAIEDIRKSGKKLYGNLNRFLYWYDQGLLFHYAGQYDSSLAQFENAEVVLDELYARSITNEAASLLTNDNLRPYRGRRYEQVLLHQFLSLNYLAKGEYDESLVETRKVQLVFDRFKSKNRGKDRYDDEGMSHVISSIAFDARGERDNATISLYKAVKAYRDAPVALPEAVRNLAYYRLERDQREADITELDLAPTKPAEEVNGFDPDATEILLLGYAGQGPILGEKVFWGTYVVGGVITAYHHDANGDTALMVLPAPPLPASEEKNIEEGRKTSAGTTFHIKFSLPEMKTRPSRTRGFTLEVPATGRKATSIMLTDIDRLLAQDLQDNRPATLARTALRVVLRTIAAQRAKAKMQSEIPALNLLVNLGTDIAADQLEKADTRLCFLLPKTIHLTRLPVEPGTHTVNASALDAGGSIVDTHVWKDIEVTKGEKKFLFYPCLR